MYLLNVSTKGSKVSKHFKDRTSIHDFTDSQPGAGLGNSWNQIIQIQFPICGNIYSINNTKLIILALLT